MKEARHGINEKVSGRVSEMGSEKVSKKSVCEREKIEVETECACLREKDRNGE